MINFIKRHRHLTMFFVIVIAGTFLLASRGLPERKVRVVVTIEPLAFFAEPIVGALGNVDVLVPRNIDPSTYQPTLVDRERVRGADIFLSWGQGVDPFAEDMLKEDAFLKMIHTRIGDDVVSALKKQKKDLPESTTFWWNPTTLAPISKSIRDVLVRWDLKGSGYFQVHEQQKKNQFLQDREIMKEEKEKRRSAIIFVNDRETASFVQMLGYQTLMAEVEKKKETIEGLLKKYPKVVLISKDDIDTEQIQAVKFLYKDRFQVKVLSPFGTQKYTSYGAVLSDYYRFLDGVTLK